MRDLKDKSWNDEKWGEAIALSTLAQITQQFMMYGVRI